MSSGTSSWREGRTGSDRYLYMFEHALNTDCTFNIGDQQIEAHRLFLSAASPVFEAMFLADMSEKKTGVINITDISYNTFKSVLRYMYTYKMDFKDWEDAVEIYMVAHKYQLEDLGALCQERIKKDLSPDNVWKIIDLAQTLDDQTLIDQSIQVLRTDTEACLKSVKLATLSEDQLSLLLSQDSLSLDYGELSLIHLVVNWARATAMQRGLQGSDSDVREIVLPRVLPLLRLATLSEAEFNMIVNFGLWLSEEDKEILISKYTDKFPDYLCKNLKPRILITKKKNEIHIMKTVLPNISKINLPIEITNSNMKLITTPSKNISCLEFSVSENILVDNFVVCTQVNPQSVMNKFFKIDTYKEHLHVTVINFTDSKKTYREGYLINIESAAIVATTKYEGLVKYNSTLTLTFTDPVKLVKNNVYLIKLSSRCGAGWYETQTTSSLSEFFVKNILFTPSSVYAGTKNASLFKFLTFSYE